MIILTATITKLDGTLITIDYRNLLSLSRTITDRSDMKLPAYGVISNHGSLRFVDYDGSMLQMIQNRQLVSGMAVTLYLENTISKAKASVGEFLTKQWSYDNNNRQISVRLQDELEEWQNIALVPVEPSYSNELNHNTFAEVYKALFLLTPSKYNMLNYELLDEPTKTQLSNVWVEYFVLTSNTLWNAWTQFCDACQVHIYKNNAGNTICHYNGGS